MSDSPCLILGEVSAVNDYGIGFWIAIFSDGHTDAINGYWIYALE